MQPFITIIIPCRNEEKFIAKCFDSILRQDYSQNNYEIILIDGMSEDKTRQIIKAYQKKECPQIILLDNPKKRVSPALNIGIRKARGKYIIRMDAHTYYPPDYIKKCLEYLKKIKADNVGGIWITQPGANTLTARAIALGLSSRFGVGLGNTFRTSQKQGYVETVPFGAYKKEVFDRVGLFNEKLYRTEDIELNSRLRKSGGKIFITPEIKSYYQARATLKELWKQNWDNGYEVIITAREMFYALSPRHLIPFLFVLSLILSGIFSVFFSACGLTFSLILGSYLIANLFFSLKLSLKHGLKYLLVLPIIFITLHFSYGLGSLWALLKPK